MDTFQSLTNWVAHRATLSHKTIGFIPTMGNLHQGHLALVNEAKQHNDYTVVSIFVNPTQFNQPDDFTHYPRTLEADLFLLSQAGVDAVFIPTQVDLYPDNYRYQMHETIESLTLEGESRPGHYTGVLTIVMKLFNLVKPTHAYFGEKDYQQFLLIKGMVEAFFMNIELIVCKTVRENSSLALSSRNNRLTADQKLIAEHFAALFHQPHKNCTEITEEIKACGILVDYIKDYQQRRYAAIKIGNIRLIDNYLLSK